MHIYLDKSSLAYMNKNFFEKSSNTKILYIYIYIFFFSFNFFLLDFIHL